MLVSLIEAVKLVHLNWLVLVLKLTQPPNHKLSALSSVKVANCAQDTECPIPRTLLKL